MLLHTKRQKEKEMGYIDWAFAIIIYLLSVMSVGYQYAVWRWNVWDNFGPFYGGVHGVAFPITRDNYNEDNLFAKFRKEPQPYIFLVAIFWPFNIASNIVALLYKYLRMILWVAALCLLSGLGKDNEDENAEEV